MSANGTAQSGLISLTSVGTEARDSVLSSGHAGDGSARLATLAECDFAVIGAGSAGVAAALAAKQGGARVVVLERSGDAPIRAGWTARRALAGVARAAHAARRGARRGLSFRELSVDFAAALQFARSAQSAATEAARARLIDAGVELVRGDARFVDTQTLELNGSRVRFRRALVATGGHAAVPAIDGLAETQYFTEDTLLSLSALPGRLVVIGGGATGAELAQVFARLGSEVTLIENKPRLLASEADAASTVIERVFANENIRLLLGSEAVHVEQMVHGSLKRVHYEQGLDRGSVDGDVVLIAIGHAPRLEGLRLESAEIDYDKYGIRVDDFLRTTNSAVYAAGAVCSLSPSVQTAAALGRLAAQNALFSRRSRKSALLVPECTGTDPAVARVGSGHGVEAGWCSLTVELRETDRAKLDDDEAGFARLHYRRGSRKPSGAVVVAPDAGELIAQITTLIQGGGRFAALAKTEQVYPAYGELWQRLATAFERESKTGFWQRLLAAVSGYEWLRRKT